MYPLWAVVLHKQVKITCTVNELEELRLPLIDSDLLYRGTLYGRLDCTLIVQGIQ